MANALGRDIQVGEIVVLKKELFKPQYQSIECRKFKVMGGFGMSASTMGRAIYGNYVDSGEDGGRYNGEDISVSETNALTAG